MLTCSTEKFEKKLKFFPPADDTKDNFPCWANVRKILVANVLTVDKLKDPTRLHPKFLSMAARLRGGAELSWPRQEARSAAVLPRAWESGLRTAQLVGIPFQDL